MIPYILTALAAFYCGVTCAIVILALARAAAEKGER
jgi:hypothetical protein